MDKLKIDREAKELQLRIWEQRKLLWPGREAHPLDALDPEIAARVLGIDLQYFEELKFSFSTTRFETAGLFDRRHKKIAVARRFGLEVMRFTAAHEIGHWLLHPTEVTLHRDRPIKGLELENGSREPIEREADYFAACFLMPPRLVERVFQSMFLTKEPFVFDDTAAHLLRPYDMDSLLRPEIDSLDREITLVSARSYRGRHFEKTLAQLFGVSATSMAIRIKELKLIKQWP